MAYAVVRTDNLSGTDVRGQLVSIKYMGADGETETAIENGNILKVGALKTGEREIYVGGVPSAGDALKDIVLIASPEVVYDEHKHNLDDYINEEGKAARGYYLHDGNTFSVTKLALDGKATPVAGDIVELKAGTKLNVVATATAGSTVVGKIIAVETAGKYTYYVIRVATVAATVAAESND